MKQTLYKASSSGKPVEWTIEVEGGAFRTHDGYVGGAITTSEWTQCKPKNVGKSNETTAEQQALLEAQAKVVKKREKGYTDNLEDVAAAKTAAWLEPMLAQTLEKRPKAVKPNDVFFIQPKLDGIRCIVTAEGMFTRNGKPIVSCPHILSDAQRMLKYLPEGARIDGELYNHMFKDDFNSLVSLIRKGQELPYEDMVKVQYHIYDVDVPGLDFSSRYLGFMKYEDHGLYPSIRMVHTSAHLAEGEWGQLITDLQTEFVKRGYEGAMIRLDTPYEHKRSDSLLKVKTFMDDEFVIEDIMEGDGNRSGMAGRLVILLKDGSTCEAGIAGGVTFYKELLENRSQLLGKTATVRFFGYTPAGKLRFPVVKTVARIDQ